MALPLPLAEAASATGVMSAKTSVHTYAAHRPADLLTNERPGPVCILMASMRPPSFSYAFSLPATRRCLLKQLWLQLSDLKWPAALCARQDGEWVRWGRCWNTECDAWDTVFAMRAMWELSGDYTGF